MWIYVFLGNVLRGVGETPVQPLGISYIDDYAQSENAALFIGKVAFPLTCTSRFGVDQDRFYLRFIAVHTGRDMQDEWMSLLLVQCTEPYGLYYFIIV